MKKMIVFGMLLASVTGAWESSAGTWCTAWPTQPSDRPLLDLSLQKKEEKAKVVTRIYRDVDGGNNGKNSLCVRPSCTIIGELKGQKITLPEGATLLIIGKEFDWYNGPANVLLKSLDGEWKLVEIEENASALLPVAQLFALVEKIQKEQADAKCRDRCVYAPWPQQSSKNIEDCAINTVIAQKIIGSGNVYVEPGYVVVEQIDSNNITVGNGATLLLIGKECRWYNGPATVLLKSLDGGLKLVEIEKGASALLPVAWIQEE